MAGNARSQEQRRHVASIVAANSCCRECYHATCKVQDVYFDNHVGDVLFLSLVEQRPITMRNGTGLFITHQIGLCFIVTKLGDGPVLWDFRGSFKEIVLVAV